MRQKIMSFFAEEEPPERIKLVRVVYIEALEILLKEKKEFIGYMKKKESIQYIKEYYLSELLIETLKQLVIFFRKNPDLVRYESDKKLLSNFEYRKDTPVLDVVEKLKGNLKDIKPGFFYRDQVYSAFVTVLTESCFQKDKLLLSERNRQIKELEEKLEKNKSQKNASNYAKPQSELSESQHDDVENKEPSQQLSKSAEQFVDIIFGGYKSEDVIIEKFKLLLKEDHSINDIHSVTFYTALHYSVELGLAKVTKFLLKQGANVNSKAKGVTPLHLAVKESRQDVLEALFNSKSEGGIGIDLNTRDGKGRTPLHYAVQERNTLMVHLLLVYGADPTLRDSSLYWRRPIDVLQLGKPELLISFRERVTLDVLRQRQNSPSGQRALQGIEEEQLERLTAKETQGSLPTVDKLLQDENLRTYVELYQLLDQRMSQQVNCQEIKKENIFEIEKRLWMVDPTPIQSHTDSPCCLFSTSADSASPKIAREANEVMPASHKQTTPYFFAKTTRYRQTQPIDIQHKHNTVAMTNK